VKGHNYHSIVLAVGFIVTEEEIQDANIDIVGFNKHRCEQNMEWELARYEIVSWRREPEWHINDFLAAQYIHKLTARPIVRKYAPPPP